MVYDDEIFEKLRYTDLQKSKEVGHRDTKEPEIEQFVLLVPISDKIDFGLVFTRLRRQFEEFIPKSTWTDRVKTEYDLAFN